jgi:hypothetical protein
MPVEHQSSMTDTTSLTGVFAKESSLTTLDPAPSAVDGINARVSRPYGSTNQQPSYPSAIEQQSSLTEIDGTVKSGFGQGNRPYSGGNFATGAGGNIGGGRPLSNHGQPFNPSCPSSIEQQSSLTEIDSIPSALTEIDNIPSSLTVLDDLPHRLEDQSPLTAVDDLPYGLQEQSPLTEVDGLPHGLSEQSPLTEVDGLKKDALSSLMSETSSSNDSGIQLGTSTTSPTVTAADRAIAFSATSTTTTSTTTEITTTTVELPISPAMKSYSDAVSAAITMSNWSLPDGFTDAGAVAAVEIPQSNHGESRVQSPPGSQSTRAPAVTSINTTYDLIDVGPSAPLESNKPGVVLNPLVSDTVDEPSGRNSPVWKPAPLSATNLMNKRDSTPLVPAKPASLLQAIANRTLNPQSSASGTELESDEIFVEPSLPVSTTPIQPLIEFSIDTEHSDGEDDIQSEVSGEDDESDGADIVNEIDEFEALLSKNDGVSALIRGLQSTMSLSRSPSGSSSVAKPSFRGEDKDNHDLSPVKRNDSTSSRTSLGGNDLVARLAESSLEDTKSKVSPTQMQAVSPTPPVLVGTDNTEGYDLPRLSTTQFEWTFSESEKATYERIYSLWERPAEECVSCKYTIIRV